MPHLGDLYGDRIRHSLVLYHAARLNTVVTVTAFITFERRYDDLLEERDLCQHQYCSPL